MEWAARHGLAIGSALFAALFAAVGIVIRQRAIQAEAAHRNDSSAIVTSWVRQPTWWAGTLVAIVGYAFQAFALAHGSLLLVQPLLVSALLFVLPLGAKFSKQHVTRADWYWAMLLTVALAVFVLVGQPREGHYRAPVPAWSVALAGAIPVVILCVVFAHRTIGRTRAMLLASAVAVLVAMIVLAVTVTVLQQSAFHAGALQASVPVMLVGEPMLAVLLGVVILGEHLHVRGAGGLILAVAVIAMIAATIALGRESVIPMQVDDETAAVGRPASDATSTT